MSEATDLLAEGDQDVMAQHGVLFTVDGDASGERIGVYDAFVYGNVLTDSGVVQKRGATLTFLRATWTPVIGKRVTVEGLTFVVDAIQRSPTHFAVTLVESHA
jgi:hypothetical protein